MYRDLFDIAVVCYAERRYEAALAAFEDAHEHARGAGDRAAEADAAYQLGNVLRTLSRYEEAEAMFQEAYAYAVEQDLPVQRADCLLGMGNAHRGKSRYREARAAYRSALSIYEAEDQPLGVVDVTINLAVVDYLAGDYATAQCVFEVLLNGRTPPLDAERAMMCRATLGNVLRERGRFGEAERLLDEAREHFSEAGDPIAVADCDLNLGNVYHQTGREREADRVWRGARVVFNKAHLFERGADCTLDLGLLALQRGELSTAVKRLENARNIYASFGLAEHTADCIYNIGFALLVDGHPDAAAEKFSEAMDLYKQHRLVPNPDWTATMGEARRLQGRLPEARSQFVEARQAYADRDLVFDVAHMQMCEARVLWDDALSQPDVEVRAREALCSAVPGLLKTDDVRFQFVSVRDRAAWARLVENALSFVLEIADAAHDLDVLGDLVESFTSVGWYAVGEVSENEALSTRCVREALRFGERVDAEDPRAVFDDLVLPLLPTPPLRVLGPDGPRLALNPYLRGARSGNSPQAPLVTW